MKYSLSIFFILTVFTVRAQFHEHISPPKTYWQSYDFQKQLEYSQTVYYKSDSQGYEPKMVKIVSFNKEGYIIQEYSRILGKFGSETAHNYVYTNGALDSINTVASAKNFNTTQKFHYNEKGVLQKIVSTGVYANYTESYTYDDNGMVLSIVRKHQKGGGNHVTYDHRKNIVTEIQINTKGDSTIQLYVYDGDDLVAFFKKEDKPQITFYDDYRRIYFRTEVKEDPLEYILKMRRLKQENQKEFNNQIADIMGAATSKILFDIPAESRNADGDWIRRLQVDRRFSKGERRLAFQKLKYADGSTSGSTDFDLIFDSKVKNLK
ncbi:MAG: hypothetical protein ACK5NK_07790 [Niabella sp.]